MHQKYSLENNIGYLSSQWATSMMQLSLQTLWIFRGTQNLMPLHYKFY
jgi:hypothetical protein